MSSQDPTPDDLAAAARREFGEPHVATAAGPRLGERAGDLIDKYRLIAELGEGGMGTVWLAEQLEPVRRHVALKVIKLGMDTREVVARFEAERQALALMDHPHIAKVHDGGSTSSGRPYFVMERVEGVPITEYCRRGSVGLRDRLELFAAVCEAIQHAHHKGVIHRDIKPSNVLVSLQDGRPAPKVIDFGIAKATSAEWAQRTSFTQYGQIIGTPEYMAPEQAGEGGLDIDSRVDVYSLGVLLYELLTGSKPFDVRVVLEAGYAELMRTIREVDPLKPSTRVSTSRDAAAELAPGERARLDTMSRRLRGDLDWIVMKALEKDRDRRYETPSGLAADVRRFLGHEPIEAAPPSATYRLRRLARRHRRALMAAAVMILLLVGGAVGTGVGWWNSHRANVALGESLAEEERLRKVAEANEERAKDAEALTAEREERIRQVSTFQSRQLNGLDVPAMGEDLHRRLLELLPGEGRDGLAAPLSELNYTDLTRDLLRRNLFGRTLAAIDASYDDQPVVKASLYEHLGMTLVELGFLDDGLIAHERALAVREDGLGQDHQQTLVSLNNLGDLHRQRGDLAAARGYLERALAGLRRSVGDEHHDTAVALCNVGLTLMNAPGGTAEAEPYLREACEVLRRTSGPEASDTLSAEANWAHALMYLERYEEAEAVLERVIETRTRVLGADHVDTLIAIGLLGGVHRLQDHFAEAERSFRAALDGHRRASGDDHPRTVNMLWNLGRVLVPRGALAEAEPVLREALAGDEKIHGPQHPTTQAARIELARVLIGLEQLDEAQALLEEAWAGLAAARGPEHPETTGALDQLEALARRRVAGSRAMGDALALTRDLERLGTLLAARGRAGDAEPVLTEALGLAYESAPDDELGLLRLQGALGAAVAEQGRHADAEPLLLEVAERALELEGPEGAASARSAVERVVELYEGWDAAEAAAEWRGVLAELGG